MSQLMRVLVSFVNIYQILIFVRIALTWFSGTGYGGVQDALARITDPYLNWFRRFPLRAGFLDLSPVVALGALSLASRILGALARYGTITLGIILVMVLQAVWGAVSFFLGFLIIVLILRLAGGLLRQDPYSPFWRAVGAVSDPVIYRINRALFKNRIINSTPAVLVPIAVLGAGHIALGVAVGILSRMLAGLPV